MAFSLLVTVGAVEVPVVPADDGATPPAALPLAVSAHDSKLHLSGRFDLVTPGKASCQWSASAVTIRFRGSALNADLNLWKNRAEVVVDGRPGKVLVSTGSARRLYALVSGLPEGEHTVLLFKCTEAFIWNMDVYGFQLNAGATLLPAPVPARRIEVLGDSITAGAGNEAPNAGDKFSPLTENAYWTYGAIAARAFAADYTCCARSGICLFPNTQETLPDRYGRVLPEDVNSPAWSFPDPQPDVVVVNLGTNDFTILPVEEESWVRAYQAFLDRIRQHAAHATIYVATGPLLHDRPGQPLLSTCRRYLQRIVAERKAKGDARVRFIEFAEQDESLGIGADYHPSVRRNIAMAKQLVHAVQADLGWQPEPGY